MNKIRSEKKTCRLDGAGIDALSEAAGAYLASLGMERRERMRLRLLMEEALLNWRERFGEWAEVTAAWGRRFGQYQLSLTLRGAPCDPFSEDAEEQSAWYGRMLADLGLAPAYSYTRRTNSVVFKLQREKLSPLLKLLLAVGAGAAVSALGMLLPEAARAFAAENVAGLLTGVFLGLLSTVAIPMVFLSVADGICGVGDIAAFGTVGKGMIGHFLGASFLSAFVVTLLGLPFFRLTVAAGEADASALSDAAGALANLFPKNLFASFAEGNAAQIIVIALAFGVALLALGSRAEGVTRAIGQIHQVFLRIMEWLAALLPAYIFLTIVKLVWSGALHGAVRAWRPLVLLIAYGALLLIGYFIVIAVREKVSPLLLAKKTLDVFLISLSTASSAAAHSAAFECAEHRLGVGGELVSLGVPIGNSFCKPAVAAVFVLMTYFSAETYGVEVSVPWLLLAFFLCGVMTVATPPVTSGAMASYALIFTPLGIPAEALGVALALDVVMDAIRTAVNGTWLQMDLVHQAGKLGKLDREILRKEP